MRLSHDINRLLSRLSWSRTSYLNRSSKQGSGVHLTVQRLVSTAVWVDVMSLEFVSCWHRSRVSITVGVECWLTEVSSHCWIRKPSRSKLHFFQLLLEFSLLLRW
jgi:hypothetical protein